MGTRSDSVQRAIAVVKARTESGEKGEDAWRQLVAETLAEDEEQGLDGRLINGLVSLTGLLLHCYSEEVGRSPDAVLSAIAIMVEQRDDEHP